jgi:hypothetical protein
MKGDVVIGMSAKAYKQALKDKVPKKYMEYNGGAANDVSITIQNVASITLEGPFAAESKYSWTSPFAVIQIDQKLRDNRFVWRVEPLQNGRGQWGAASSWHLSQKESEALWYAINFAR